MTAFVPREKLSKKARKALDEKKRAAWDCDPRTRRVESKKQYNRKRLRAMTDAEAKAA